MDLTRAQQLAIHNISNYASKYKPQATAIIHHVRKMTNIPLEQFDQAISNLKNHAQLCLHFHPEQWKDRGTIDEVLQQIKLLWRVLVRFGKGQSP